MVDFVDEIQEELRQERISKLWSNYGTLLIAASLAITLAVVGISWHDHYKQRKNVKSSRLYTRSAVALEEGDAEAKTAAIQTLATMHAPYSKGYYFLSRLLAARARLANAEGATSQAARQEALQELFSLANDARLADHPELQDMAALEWLSAASQPESGADPEALAAMLERLSTPGHPYASTVLELKASLALQRNDTKTAITLLQQLQEGADSLASQRQRASRMLEVLTAPAPAAESGSAS